MDDLAVAMPPVGDINGVSLYTLAGKARERFGEADRLRLLGDFEPELKVFQRLFTPKLSPYIRRRSGENWYTVDHALRQDDVVKHLLANRVPSTTPIWIGTRAWSTTMHAAIDVDFRGDRADFDERCRKAEYVLLSLGIPKHRMMVCPSPSGGRHYRIFFRRPVFTSDLPAVFLMAGLPLAPGKFEVFPRENQGLRLPFGYIPGESHDPMAWVEFIRAYESRRFPRVDWEQMVKRAHTRESRRGQVSQEHNQQSEKVSSAGIPQPIGLGIPRRFRTPSVLPSPTVVTWKRPPAPNVVSSSMISKEQIECHWRQGIAAPGTRVSLTKMFAWHLIFAERLTAKDASRRLVEWVYRTGRTSSRTVQADLAHGSRKAEQQTVNIVAWCDSQRRQSGRKPRRLFAQRELDHILALTNTLSDNVRQIRARFLLDFLNFAKRMGRRSEAGYECQPSVEGIIKKWENCHGAAKYKAHLDWGLKVGLLVLVKEKYQKAHRPRTFSVVVPTIGYEECTLSYQDAVDYIQQARRSIADRQVSSPDHVSADGYSKFVSLEEREEYYQPGDQCRTGIDVGSKNPVCSIQDTRIAANAEGL
jgi:hypothetical protein